MISFKVIKRKVGVGPKKGQDAFVAEPKSISKFSADWLVERIVRETSLSEGDVRNVLITLRNIFIEVITLGGALDLGDIFSFRTVIPSKMEAKEEDVCATSLKRPRIIVSWKENIRKALKKIEVEVDNPKRKEKNKKPKP
ncbi:MAG: DNA-binding protein [Hoylesella marshii]|uniref:HU family DNA-binding protein n=1 Tax=Hoylesella marshii TaxID=189722 RepID=UPI003F9F7E4C